LQPSHLVPAPLIPKNGFAPNGAIIGMMRRPHNFARSQFVDERERCDRAFSWVIVSPLKTPPRKTPDTSIRPAVAIGRFGWGGVKFNSLFHK
jgi:hypothetical protein